MSRLEARVSRPSRKELLLPGSESGQLGLARLGCTRQRLCPSTVSARCEEEELGSNPNSEPALLDSIELWVVANIFGTRFSSPVEASLTRYESLYLSILKRAIAHSSLFAVSLDVVEAFEDDRLLLLVPIEY